MDTLLPFGVLFLTLAGQSLCLQDDLFVYADCHSKEFIMHSKNGTKLASKSSPFTSCPRSLAFAETDNRRLYWIEDTRPPSIGYLNIRNEQFEGHSHYVDLPSDLLYKSLQVDDLNGLVYFIANESIVVKSLDENMGVILGIPQGSKPSLIAIDPHNKYLFWFDNRKRELVRANMDGTNTWKMLGNFPVDSVSALTLDIPEQRIYIAINDRMLNVAYNARGKLPVVSTGDSASKFLSIALDSDKVLYTVENNPQILFVLKTTDITYNYGSLFIIRRNPDAVRSIVTSYTSPNKLPNDCSINNGNCSGLCVTKGPNAKTCLSGIPKDANVRLGPSGRVEVSFKGQWHSACADGFTDDEAIVVCRQLRHYGPVKILAPQQGSGPMLKSLKCPYSATSLSTCFVAPESATCASGSAAVDCQVQNQGITPTTNKRLAGGRRASEGWLEVFHQGAWAPVCDPGHFFNKDAAMALCRDVGNFNRGEVSSKRFTSTNMVNTWRQDIKCFLGATSLEYCYKSPWQQITCHPDDVIAVECFPSTPELPTAQPLTAETSATELQQQSTTELTFPDSNDHSTTTAMNWGRSGTIRIPDDKQFKWEDEIFTDLPVQTSTEKRTGRFAVGPAWLVAVIASVGTSILIILTISLSVFCYRKRKREDEPFGIHSNPLVQQMSMMEQNELMMKYLEEKRQLGCLSDSKSSLNYNSVGVLVPGSIDGLNMQGTDTFKTGGNRYETFPRGPVGARDDNALNEHAYTLQKQAQGTPIWASPLPDLPPGASGQNKQNADDGVYLEPIGTYSEVNYSMYQSNGDITQDAANKDEDNYDLPTMAKRKMSIDPRFPVF